MHRKSIAHIIEHGTPEDMQALKDIFVGVIDYLKVSDYDKYEEVEYKLYKLAHGKHIDADLAKCWVSKLQNKDGTVGAHWSIEDTSKYANGYDKNDWYVVLNMIYSDFYNPQFDANVYITLAKDWLSDKDADDCKLLKYYFHVVAKR